VIDYSIRPVPRWLHAWAVATAIATLVLLALGQLVTSFQAGMADPIWPTEPWYLFVIGWQEPSRGYLIEHTHRIAAFAIGGIVSVLALGLCWADPSRRGRWAGLAAIMVLLIGYGQFHGGLISQRDARPEEVRLPVGGTVVSLLGLVASVAVSAVGLVRRSWSNILRFLGVLALVGVMIQGLFGGARVLLNALMGGQLALVHGIFAQVVFCLLIAIAVLSGPHVPAETVNRHSRRINRGSLFLAGLLFAQIMLGAFVRHAPTALTQRLHFLTAFVATGVVAWLLIRIAGQPATRRRVRSAFWLLGFVLALQLILGVEAWMERFGQYTLPDLVRITTAHAAIRTAHAFVGSGLLGTAVVIALRLGRPAGPVIDTPDRTDASHTQLNGFESRGALARSGVGGEVL